MSMTNSTTVPSSDFLLLSEGRRSRWAAQVMKLGSGNLYRTAGSSNVTVNGPV